MKKIIINYLKDVFNINIMELHIADLCQDRLYKRAKLMYYTTPNTISLKSYILHNVW